MTKYQKEHVSNMCFVTDILCFIIWLLQCSVVCGVDLLMEVGQLPHHVSRSTVAKTTVMSSGLPPVNCHWFSLALLANGELWLESHDSLLAKATTESTIP